MKVSFLKVILFVVVASGISVFIFVRILPKFLFQTQVELALVDKGISIGCYPKNEFLAVGTRNLSETDVLTTEKVLQVFHLTLHSPLFDLVTLVGNGQLSWFKFPEGQNINDLPMFLGILSKICQRNLSVFSDTFVSKINKTYSLNQSTFKGIIIEPYNQKTIEDINSLNKNSLFKHGYGQKWNRVGDWLFEWYGENSK
jgi:hypothetical protein